MVIIVTGWDEVCQLADSGWISFWLIAQKQGGGAFLPLKVFLTSIS